MDLMVIQAPSRHPTARAPIWKRGGKAWLRTTKLLRSTAILPFVWSTFGVAVCTIVGLVLTAVVALPNVSMVFLLGIVFSAARFGIGPALLSSLLSFLAYNYFFIEPRFTLTVYHAEEFFALFIFLAIAMLISTIAGRAREQAAKATERARASRHLYEYARRLSPLANLQTIVESAAAQAHRNLGLTAVVVIVNEGVGRVAASCPPEDRIDHHLLRAAREICEKHTAAGAGTELAPELPWLLLPLRTSEGPIGAIGVRQSADEPGLDAEARTLFQTLAELTSTALERVRLDQEIIATRSVAETERVRNTLLASISHDFRTPLASILGAASGLIDYGSRLSGASRDDLLAQIKDEAEHLDDMVRNLLAITRVEAGALEVNKDWVDVRELLDRAVVSAKRRGATQTFEVVVHGDVPFIPADPILLSQVLANVIGNAVRYSGADARIVLEAGSNGNEIVLSVADDGAGIPPEVLPHLFEKFVGSKSGTDAGYGTGLGLAIVKGIVEAHRGSVLAESPVVNGRGTRITIRLPQVVQGP